MNADGAEQAFKDVRALDNQIEGQDGKGRELGKGPGQRDIKPPDKAAVKNRGDQNLTAGTKGIVSRIGIAVKGHIEGIDQDHIFGNPPNLLRGIVNSREEAGESRQNTANKGAHQNRKNDELSILVPRFLPGAMAAQKLTHENADYAAHGHPADREEIPYGIIDIHGCHNDEAPAGEEDIG